MIVDLRSMNFRAKNLDFHLKLKDCKVFRQMESKNAFVKFLKLKVDFEQ